MPGQSSVCIVGAGAAGLTLAHALSQHGWRVILVEGGGAAAPQPDVEDTYRTLLLGTPHRGVHEGRFRAWGGSTTRWGGQLWPWERHEFEPRPYLSLDGWPISYDDVASHYADALTLLGIPAATLTPEAAAARGVLLPPLDAADFALKFSIWLPWRLRNLGRTIGAAVRRHANVTAHLGATALGIAMDGSGRKAEGVRVRTALGAELVLAADVVVVAAGSIESTRLLLATGGGAGGLGNGSGWLGRGFMDHLSVRIGRFRPRDEEAFARMFSPLFVRDVQYTPRMVLQPALLERERLLAAYGHWEVTAPPDSGLHIVREKLRAVQSGGGLHFSRAELRGLASGARDVLALARGLVFERRRYFPRDASVHLRVDSEQRPDPESRIVLTGERDALGLPRVAVDWRVSELERHTVRRTAKLLADELTRRGIGVLEEGRDTLDASVPWGDLKSDAYHMMGGTRMARKPDGGVVDSNWRVFGTDNVYVASASTFPTGGMANPTLTLLALTLRLARHLTR